MLSAICASKLYRASNRKDKIEAAFDNPINAELVGQLATALDEQYKTPEYLVKEKQKKPAEDTTGSVDTSESGSEESTAPAGPHLGGSSHGGPPPSADSEPSEGDEPESSDSTSSDEGSNPDGDLPPTPEFSNVEESTNTDKSTVQGSLMRNPFKNMRQVADQIKGMLNFKDSTCGVNRILCKENELWIYYNDDINLNSVMAEVIETLNAASYSYLEFNRLARSDNAVVFLIDFSDSNNMMVSDPSGSKK
ncbi:MAG: hypothetical protein NC548_55495 [Lachnospiraceae bacterium]|nr:hypothetical protein [Lachnospiraceae bacterium]